MEASRKVTLSSLEIKANSSKEDARNFSMFRNIFPNENIQKGTVISSTENALVQIEEKKLLSSVPVKPTF